MRRSTGILLLATISGCGGDGAVSPPPPPPPPGTVGPPASITVRRGDGQTGEPGAPLPLLPAVIVKDASGRVVAGANVTFAVDSGGGSVAGGAATTGSDGIATAGAWTLGPAEGRNVLLVSAAGGPSTRLGATATIPTVDVAAQTMPPGGGTLTVNRPGTPVDGLRIEVPAGAFPAPTAIQIQYASSGQLPHVPEVTVATPIVTIGTDAADPAALPITIRLPAAIADSEVPLVAVVDPATGFLDALATVSWDATGVTAAITQLDEAAYRNDPAPAALRPAGAAIASLRLKLAVYLVKASLLHTVTYDSGFLPGVDDWEFADDATPVFPNTGAGQVVLARYYFRNQKSRTQGPLWNRFLTAPGASASDIAGHQWSAGIAKQFDALVQPYLAAAVANRARNPVAYDRATIQSIAASFVASGGAPQIVAFVDPAAHTYQTVLAYFWNGPEGVLRHANPIFPGNTTRTSTWSSNGLSCTTYCVAVAGINHLIGYQTQLSREHPDAVAGTIYRDRFPTRYAPSSSPIIGPAGGNDTVFVVGDTTRIWIECPTCIGQEPTTIPLQHGAAGLQRQGVHVEGKLGWALVGGDQSNGFLLDLTKLPSPNDNHWADFRIGIEVRAWTGKATGATAPTGWAGWKVYRIIEFHPTLTASPAAPTVPMTLAIGSAGGPELPPGLTYVFKWGDDTQDLTRPALPASVQHTYQEAGTYDVVMEMRHPHANELVGRATATVEVDPTFGWMLESATMSAGSLLPAGGLGPEETDTLIYQIAQQWVADMQSTTPTTGIVAQVLSQGAGGCQAGVAISQYPGGVWVPSDQLEIQDVRAAVAVCGAADYSGSFAMGPFGNGTLIGSAQSLHPPDVIQLEGGSINATMTGPLLQGTFTALIRYSNGNAPVTMTFTARQAFPAAATGPPR